MNPTVNMLNLVRQILPPHKRQPVRLSMLSAFIQPLQRLLKDFYVWRSNARMMVNVNSQVKILEGFLRRKYGQPINIKIETYSDGLLLVCLAAEGIIMQPEISMSTENRLAEIPLAGEIRTTFGDADFIVYIPATIDINLVCADIENYKQALITYKIIQN